LAKQAWAELDGDAQWTVWEVAFPDDEVEAFLNEPADGPAGSAIPEDNQGGS
jgi:hypothetical protein